jgi:Flp pilus assembly pilin Flp
MRWLRSDPVRQVRECVPAVNFHKGDRSMTEFLRNVWIDNEGQDIAEYALMLTVLLVLVFATVSAIGTNANTIFGDTAAALE